MKLLPSRRGRFHTPEHILYETLKIVSSLKCHIPTLILFFFVLFLKETSRHIPATVYIMLLSYKWGMPLLKQV